MTTTLERPTAAVAAAPRRRKRPYLHRLDLIRMTTFSLVIFVHTLTQTTDEMGSVGVNTTSMLLHFTRNAFFALTGFVLTYQSIDKDDFTTVGFWRRRITLVIVPYLAWSFIYWVVTDMWVNGRLGEIPTSLGDFARLTAWGLSGFQMYFLFVMLQVYLLFPAVLWLIKRTAGHHRQLLAASLTLQMVITLVITHWNPPAPISDYWWHHYATFVPYQFFILYGAVAAANRETVERWLAARTWWLVGALVVTTAFALGTYFYRVWGDDQSPSIAGAAFQPTLVPFVLVMLACMFAVGTAWEKRLRKPDSWFANVVAYAADRSFALFLGHVFVLFLILLPKRGTEPWLLATVGQPWGTILTYIATIAGTLLLVEVLRRLPGSRYLTGRPRITRPASAGSAAPTTGSDADDPAGPVADDVREMVTPARR